MLYAYSLPIFQGLAKANALQLKTAWHMDLDLPATATDLRKNHPFIIT